MASSAYKNKTGLPFLFSFCLIFFFFFLKRDKLSENMGEAAGLGWGGAEELDEYLIEILISLIINFFKTLFGFWTDSSELGQTEKKKTIRSFLSGLDQAVCSLIWILSPIYFNYKMCTKMQNTNYWIYECFSTWPWLLIIAEIRASLVIFTMCVFMQ